MDVDDVDDERLLVGVRLIFCLVVHVELGLIKEGQLHRRPRGVPRGVEVDVKGEGEVVLLVGEVAPVDVLNSTGHRLSAPRRAKYLTGRFWRGGDASVLPSLRRGEGRHCWEGRGE